MKACRIYLCLTVCFLICCGIALSEEKPTQDSSKSSQPNASQTIGKDDKSPKPQKQSQNNQNEDEGDSSDDGGDGSLPAGSQLDNGVGQPVSPQQFFNNSGVPTNPLPDNKSAYDANGQEKPDKDIPYGDPVANPSNWDDDWWFDSHGDFVKTESTDDALSQRRYPQTESAAKEGIAKSLELGFPLVNFGGMQGVGNQ